MEEIWKEIKQSPKYEISNLGNFRRKGTVRNLKPIIRNGYANYQYMKPDGRLGRSRAGRLVADAFVPKADGKKWLVYKDGDTMNNRADNLEWEERFRQDELRRRSPKQAKSGYIVTEQDGTKRAFYTLEDVKNGCFPDFSDGTRLTLKQLEVMLQPRGASIKRVGSDEVSMYFKRDPEERKRVREEIDNFVEYVEKTYGKMWFAMSYKRLKSDPVVAEHYRFVSEVR